MLGQITKGWSVGRSVEVQRHFPHIQATSCHGKDSQRRILRDCWKRFFTGQMPFVSPNQQWQKITDGVKGKAN